MLLRKSTKESPLKVGWPNAAVGWNETTPFAPKQIMETHRRYIFAFQDKICPGVPYILSVIISRREGSWQFLEFILKALRSHKAAHNEAYRVRKNIKRETCRWRMKLHRRCDINVCLPPIPLQNSFPFEQILAKLIAWNAKLNSKSNLKI